MFFKNNFIWRDLFSNTSICADKNVYIYDNNDCFLAVFKPHVDSNRGHVLSEAKRKGPVSKTSYNKITQNKPHYLICLNIEDLLGVMKVGVFWFLKEFFLLSWSILINYWGFQFHDR